MTARLCAAAFRMVNAIGFYNRKFFVLILFWCLVCCVHFTLAMLIHGDWTARGLVRSPKGELTITKFVAVAREYMALNPKP